MGVCCGRGPWACAYRRIRSALFAQLPQLRRHAARLLLLARGQRLGTRGAVRCLLGRGGELRMLMRHLLW